MAKQTALGTPKRHQVKGKHNPYTLENLRSGTMVRLAKRGGGIIRFVNKAELTDILREYMCEFIDRALYRGITRLKGRGPKGHGQTLLNGEDMSAAVAGLDGFPGIYGSAILAQAREEVKSRKRKAENALKNEDATPKPDSTTTVAAGTEKKKPGRPRKVPLEQS